jgi:hypothetical protein
LYKVGTAEACLAARNRLLLCFRQQIRSEHFQKPAQRGAVACAGLGQPLAKLLEIRVE